MMGLANIIKPQGVATVVSVLFATLAVYLLCRSVYRLYFSPLAKVHVPGPKLAAITSLYEIYYDIVLDGKYIFRIEELHKKYGPIVRINPWEVHIQDNDFYDELYSPALRLDKDQWFYRMFGRMESAFDTSNAEVHRHRRNALLKFFSMTQVNQLEPRIKDTVANFLSHLSKFKAIGCAVPLGRVYYCLALDIIADYCFPRPLNMLDTPDFSAEFFGAKRNASAVSIWNRHFPFLLPILKAIPPWIIGAIDPKMLATTDLFDAIDAQAYEVVHPANPHKKPRDCILQSLFTSPALPPSERSLQRLKGEAFVLFGAGTETTANTLTVLTYHLLANPYISTRLHNELVSTFGSPPSLNGAALPGSALLSYNSLLPLPFLTAVISEGLRIALSVVARLPRKNPTSTTTYKDYVLPLNTSISMTPRDLHYDPVVFPAPMTFNPDRWMMQKKHQQQQEEDNNCDEDRQKPTATRRKQMDKFFVPFGKGHRACAGMNLAMVELYVALGNLWWVFASGGDEKKGVGLKLFKTTFEDIKTEHDYFAPFPKVSSRGLRVLVG